MVLSNTKLTSRVSSIVNRGNNLGGDKKAGIAPYIGTFLTSNPNRLRVKSTKVNDALFPINRVIRTQQYGVRATHTGRLG
jgi:hypothetical protein